MSTPPRDYSTDHAPPVPDGGELVVAPAPSASPDSAERDAWRDPVQRTDEIELLISAAAFFGLMQAPGRLVEWWGHWSSHQSASGRELGMMLMQIGYGVVFALLASFLVHLVLRGLWIGLIGLRSVFPQGVDWPRLASKAPITVAYQQAHTPSIESAIVNVDRAASVVFICASLLVAMTLMGAVIVVPLFALGGQSPGFLYVLLGLVLLPVVVQLVLDNGLASRSPKWAAKPWLRRIVTANAALFSRLTPRGLVRASLLTLQSRLSPVAFALGLTLTMMIVMLAFPLHLLGQRYADSFASYRLFDDAIVRHGITQPSGDFATVAESLLPRLDRVQVDGRWVELFVPLRPPRDDAPLRVRCLAYTGSIPRTGVDLVRAGALRDCIASLWSITLDGAPIDARAFDLARKGPQRGLLAMLPTADLAPGRHQIIATRLPIRIPGQKFREPPPPHSLLFWVAR